MGLLKQIIDISKEENIIREKAYFELARIQKKLGSVDSSIYFAKRSYLLSKRYNDPNMANLPAKLLSDNYKKLGQFFVLGLIK